MPDQSQAPGCRQTALGTGLLLGLSIVFFVTGLALIRQPQCDATCETAGLTMLYAGGPVSATIGLFFDDLVLAWPLDITFWVIAGFLAAKMATRRESSVLAIALVLVVVALGYGLVLSRLVEIAV